MSQDDKMRELVDRMEAMSPEAPPYPEDTSAVPATAPRRPMLAFAGVALAVLAVAAIPLVLSGRDREPAPAGTTVPTQTTVPASPTTVPDTTVPPLGASAPGMIFLTGEPAGSLTGNPALVPILVWVPAEPDDVAREIFYSIDALVHFEIDLPSAVDVPDFPGDMEILDARLAEDSPSTVIIDMNQSFGAGAGGLLADFTMLNQLIYTATWPEQVNEVIFLVEGEPITQFGTDGLDLTGALTRESFLDSMAAIYLTEPAVLDGDTIRVAGMANTFEATVVIQLLDIDGNVLSEEFTTASCGSGCWGTFESSVADEAAPNAIWVRLLDYSAKDGSPENAITVPVQRPNGEFAIDG